MIERLTFPTFKTRDGRPPLLAESVTKLPCGCAAFIGRICPELERPGVTSECCDNASHEALIADFRRRWSDSRHQPGKADIEADVLLRESGDWFHARESVKRAGMA